MTDEAIALRLVADQVAAARAEVAASRAEVLGAIREHRADVNRSIEQLRDDVHADFEVVHRRADKQDGRLRALERFRWQIAGGLAVLAVVIGIVEAVVLKVIL